MRLLIDMQAIQVTAHGGPEVLEVVEAPLPEPGPGQVLVEIGAAGVNFIDTYRRAGIYPTATPFILGSEGAGTVLALGPGVTDLAAGSVVAWKESATGSYATHALIAAEEAVIVPQGVSCQTAAAVMLQGLTAHYLALSAYPIQPGDLVVVHAAAGGVGLLLTQLAKRQGARVIGTVSSPEKAAAALAAGADHAVSYADFVDLAKSESDGRGAHAVFDGVGAATFDASLSALRTRGTLVLFGASSGPVPAMDPQRLNVGGSLFLTRPKLGDYTQDRSELIARTDDILGWVARGELSVTIGATFPLAEAREAHQALEGRLTSGKVLLIP